MHDSPLEAQFAFYLEHLAKDLPEPERQFRFCSHRKWQADFCWPAQKLIVEIEGGTFARGRHVRPAGYRDDCIKYNAATLAGYKILRFTGEMLDNPDYVIETVREALSRE